MNVNNDSMNHINSFYGNLIDVSLSDGGVSANSEEATVDSQAEVIQPKEEKPTLFSRVNRYHVLAAVSGLAVAALGIYYGVSHQNQANPILSNIDDRGICLPGENPDLQIQSNITTSNTTSFLGTKVFNLRADNPIINVTTIFRNHFTSLSDSYLPLIGANRSLSGTVDNSSSNHLARFVSYVSSFRPTIENQWNSLQNFSTTSFGPEGYSFSEGLTPLNVLLGGAAIGLSVAGQCRQKTRQVVVPKAPEAPIAKPSIGSKGTKANILGLVRQIGESQKTRELNKATKAIVTCLDKTPKHVKAAGNAALVIGNKDKSIVALNAFLNNPEMFDQS